MNYPVEEYEHVLDTIKESIASADTTALDKSTTRLITMVQNTEDYDQGELEDLQKSVQKSLKMIAKIIVNMMAHGMISSDGAAQILAGW